MLEFGLELNGANDCRVVLQVGANFGGIGNERDVVVGKHFSGADSGQLQQVGRVDAAAAQEDLSVRGNLG